MKSKKTNIKYILYIILIVILATIFVASIVFGVIGSFTNELKEDIEIWYNSKFEKDLSLQKQSIIWLLISATLLTLTLSFKDFKIKYID